MDHRRGMGALAAPSSGNTFGNVSGVFPGGTSGAGISNDCQVFSSAGMQSSINGGHYAVARGDNVYLGMVFGGITLTHDPSNPTYPRRDLLVISVRDPGIDSGVTESARIRIVKGDPAATPVDPALGDGDLVLSSVLVRANATATATTDYADYRRWVTARGGTTPYDPRVYTPTGSYEGQLFYNVFDKTYESWTGTALLPVIAAGPMVEYTPQLYYGGNGFDGGSSVVNLGTNPLKAGKYQLVGNKLKLSCTWKWGTAPYNAGSGPINGLLPAGLQARKGAGEQHFYGYLYTQSQGAMSWPIDVGLRAGSNVLVFAAPTSAADGRLNYYRVASSGGQAGTGVPYIANGFPEGGSLSFTAEIEIDT